MINIVFPDAADIREIEKETSAEKKLQRRATKPGECIRLRRYFLLCVAG